MSSQKWSTAEIRTIWTCSAIVTNSRIKLFLRTQNCRKREVRSFVRQLCGPHLSPTSWGGHYCILQITSWHHSTLLEVKLSLTHTYTYFSVAAFCVSSFCLEIMPFVILHTERVTYYSYWICMCAWFMNSYPTVITGAHVLVTLIL